MIHVVYSIYKSNGADTNPIYSIHDVITHTDSHWVGKVSITGGIRDELEKEYPEPEFMIQVSTVTSAGGTAE